MDDLHYTTNLTWDEIEAIGILIARKNIYPFTKRRIIAIEKYNGNKNCESTYYNKNHTHIGTHKADLKFTVLYKTWDKEQFYNTYICKYALINSMKDYFKEINQELKNCLRRIKE
jgi:hypothetical protein